MIGQGGGSSISHQIDIWVAYCRLDTNSCDSTPIFVDSSLIFGSFPPEDSTSFGGFDAPEKNENENIHSP